MDEEQTSSLLGPTPEMLAAVKVYPLIPAIKRDVDVSALQSIAARADRFLRKISVRSTMVVRNDVNEYLATTQTRP